MILGFLHNYAPDFDSQATGKIELYSTVFRSRSRVIDKGHGVLVEVEGLSRNMMFLKAYCHDLSVERKIFQKPKLEGSGYTIDSSLCWVNLANKSHEMIS